MLGTLVVATAFAFLLWVHAEGEKHSNPPPLGPVAVVLAGTLAVAVVAWVGVHRRWHPLVRVGMYLAWVAGSAALLWAIGAL